MHRRWLSLPLLSSCVSAFYPYHAGDGGNENSKRFIPLDLEPRPNDDSGLVTLDMKRIAKRNNNFNVVNSTTPTMPNAMAINEDGNDFTYFSTVKFGSEEQEMYLLIDSGSANTWVMGSNCQSDACQIHNTFGSDDSTTLKTTTETWSMTYGTGEVDGVVAKDTVRLANYTLDLGFGLASTASDDFNNYPMDGILGLGRAASEAIDTPTVMQVLDSQGHMSSNLLGIHLQRGSEHSNDGQITFGGVDSSKFSGKLAYSKTISDTSWQIAADDAGADGTSVGFTGKTAIIDTGTSYVLMPPSDASALHALIPGSSQSGELYIVPCSSTANVFITISNVQYSISPKDYVGKQSGSGCQSNIVGHQAFGPNDWILGDVFLKNVYTVLDFDNARIGFGTQKEGNGASGGSASSSSATAKSTPSATTSSKPSSTVNGKTSTTLATTTTRASSSTSTTGMANSAASTSSSPPNDSDPFSQSSATGSNAASPSISGGLLETRLTLSVSMLIAFLFGVAL